MVEGPSAQDMAIQHRRWGFGFFEETETEPCKALNARLRAAGKPAKVAILAIMRNLIEMANALVKADRMWVPKRA
jgi:hypothetical protein